MTPEWHAYFGPRTTPEGACIIWFCSKKINGYGQARQNGEMIAAHRLSWILEIGPIPAGLSVLHHCDNKPCVNPEHLFIGTQKDNMQDMVKKGRHRNSGSNEDTFGLRVSQEFLERLDNWRARQRPIISRAEAVRVIVDKATAKA